MNELNSHTTLPIIQRCISAYKLWDQARNHIPKQPRFTLGAKIDAHFLNAIELLFIASYTAREEKAPLLQRASSKLDLAKFFLQIAWELRILDTKKYTEISSAINEIGKMLGGWRKGIESIKECEP